MNALVVGADRLGNIPNLLLDFNINIAEHVSGRQATHQRRYGDLPKGIDVVILFTDFLGHNVMKSFREAARRKGLPVVACRRSVCCVRKSLECLNLIKAGMFARNARPEPFRSRAATPMFDRSRQMFRSIALAKGNFFINNYSHFFSVCASNVYLPLPRRDRPSDTGMRRTGRLLDTTVARAAGRRRLVWPLRVLC